ncbi:MULTISPECIES: glycosyltransferase [Arthrobacter]|uniref:glycosyltransferase n=1 Tax=Arthrobacter TaxID=1663 RepID=UPI0033923EC9
MANRFVEKGWDVTVLTLSEEIWSEISGTDQGLVGAIDPRVQVVRVGDGGSEEPNRRDLRRFSRFRIEAPYLWKELFRRRHRGDFPEDFHSLWFDPAIEAARSIHAAHPADLVMASASPYTSFKVARSLGGVPYVLDYRDAWAFNTFTGAQNFAAESSQGLLEADYIRNAVQVWFVNEPISAEYARRYPDVAQLMRVVPNGFDPQRGHARPRVGSRPGPPRFGYLGTLQYTAVPLQEFLAGWDLACGTWTEPGPEAVFRGKLSPTGLVPADVLATFNSGVHLGLAYEGPISKRDVGEFYRSVDALLLILPPGKFVTGGKTAEYLATGQPIVSIHDLDSAATEMLKEYPLWFPAADLRPESIAAALLQCANAMATPDAQLWEKAWQFGQTFARNRALDPVVEELEVMMAAETQTSPPKIAKELE